MQKLIIFFTAGFIFLLCGCQPDNDMNAANNADHAEYTKLANHPIDQKASNQAKELLKQHQTITKIHAVNSEKDLIIAIEVKQNKRFKLKKLTKEYKKEAEKKLPDFHIEVTTDKKIIFELDQLETSIKQKNISAGKVKKKLNKLQELMKQKT